MEEEEERAKSILVLRDWAKIPKTLFIIMIMVSVCMYVHIYVTIGIKLMFTLYNIGI